MRKIIIGAGILLFIVIALIPTVIIFNYIKNKDDKKVVLSTASATAPLPSSARIEITNGKVMIKSQGDKDFREAKEGDEVAEGSAIKTDDTGRGIVIYPNGSSTRIDKNSEITIKEYSKEPFKVNINVTLGRIWNRVAKLLGGESYETTSNSAVASVRGTSYGFGILSSGENKISVTKGVVATVCLNKRQASQLMKDQKGTFDCKTKIPKLSILDTSDKDEWFDFNKTQDSNLNEKFGNDIYKDTSDTTGTPEASPTPIPTTGPVYILDPIKLSPTLIKLSTPTPTPTPSTILKTFDSTNLKLLVTPTPSPTTNTILNQINPNLNLDTRILATPTPTPTLNTNLFQQINLNQIQLATPTPTPTPLQFYYLR